MTQAMPRTVDLSPVLRDLCTERRMTMRDLAAALRMDESTVNRWSHGTRGVPSERLESVADALCMTVSELLAAQPQQKKPAPLPHRPHKPRQAEMPLMAISDPHETPQQRLAGAGLLVDPDLHPMWELSCLLCGRGTGHDGVLGWIKHLPLHAVDCRHCGGRMFARDVGAWREVNSRLHLFFGDDDERRNDAA